MLKRISSFVLAMLIVAGCGNISTLAANTATETKYNNYYNDVIKILMDEYQDIPNVANGFAGFWDNDKYSPKTDNCFAKADGDKEYVNNDERVYWTKIDGIKYYCAQCLCYAECYVPLKILGFQLQDCEDVYYDFFGDIEEVSSFNLNTLKGELKYGTALRIGPGIKHSILYLCDTGTDSFYFLDANVDGKNGIRIGKGSYSSGIDGYSNVYYYKVPYLNEIKPAYSKEVFKVASQITNVDVSGDDVTVEWEQSSKATKYAVRLYSLPRVEGDTSKYREVVQPISGNVQSHTFTDVAAGKYYAYVVTYWGENDYKNSSPYTVNVGAAISYATAIENEVTVHWNEVSGAASYTVKLFKKAESESKYRKSKISPADDFENSYTFVGVEPGEYNAIVLTYYDASNYVQSALFAVNVSEDSIAPTVIDSSSDQYIKNGRSVEFYVRVSGNPAPTYRWKKRDDTGVWRNISGATSATYTIDSVSLADSGEYCCTIENSEGKVTTATMNLVVMEAAEISSVIASSNSVTVRWIQVKDATSYTIKIYNRDTSTLEYYLKDVLQKDNSGRAREITNVEAGEYDAVLLTYYGEHYLKSEKWPITVGQTGTVNPTIEQQPSEVETKEGETVTFSVSATGTLPLMYRWQMKESSSSDWKNIRGATSAEYTIDKVTTEMNGYIFRCTVSNSAGYETSSSATLSVSELEPYQIFIEEYYWDGDNTNFNVVATNNTEDIVAAQVFLAIYDDNGAMKRLSFGSVEVVGNSNETIKISFDGEMVLDDTVKAFLLREDAFEPLAEVDSMRIITVLSNDMIVN